MEPDRHSFGIGRIEAFSDGVLAIVITLLVLEIKSPELHDATSSTEAWRALVGLTPKIAGFFLSFLFIAVFWVNHHRFFRLVRRADWALLWLNNILLLLLCAVPFPTAFMGDHPLNPVAVDLFAVLLLAAGVVFNAMWRLARHRQFFDQTVPASVLDLAVRRGMVGPLAYALAALAAPFSIPVSWVIFGAVPLFYAWPTKEKTDN